ncbi:MAG: FkbM family methyltransferase [Bacteroidota bacterium]|jgi:FkbM family methyltransferase
MNKKFSFIQQIKSWYNKQWKKWRFALSSENHFLFIGFYKYLYSPRAGSLSAFLNEYSTSIKKDFTVIQIGANDGITHDPIHKFIKRDQWNGVLLEPQSEVFHAYLKKIYAKNKEINCLCAAIGYQDGKQQIYKIGFSDMRWATGLASFSKEKIEQAFENGIVAHNCRVHGIDLPADKNEWISEEEVEVISPTTLMKRFNLSKIDLLQIDAEGFDVEVIKMFDIASTKPRAIIFENIGLHSEDYNTCLELLLHNNYAIRKFGPNTLALKTPIGTFQKYFPA